MPGTPTVLLTLGRLPKCLELARALHSAGCRVIVAEPFRWHLCRPSRSVAASYRVTAPNVNRQAYLDELVDIARREAVELIVPVSEEALFVCELRDRADVSARVLCEQRDLLATLHDKLQFARMAQARDVPVPDTETLESRAGQDLAAAFDHVLKPGHGCSGIGVHIRKAGETAMNPGNGTLVQRFIEGEHLSSLSLLDRGREIATVVYRGTVFAGTVAICFERVDDAVAVHRWVSGFCENLEYSGFIAFDFIVDETGTAWAIECNPRVTSGAHFFDSESLAAAMREPSSASEIPFKPGRRMQWAYSTLTEAYAALFAGRFAEFRRRLAAMFTATDVVWSTRDPLPFLLMTPMSWEILWPAMTRGLSLGEATQRDIAWFSEAETAVSQRPGEP